MDMKKDNNRKFHRISFDGQANLDFINGNYTCCQIQNLSLTGMYVSGNFLLHQQKNCSIRIFHKDKSGNNSLQVNGEVVWSNDEGAGVRFTSMALEYYILLQTTLISKAERPEIILREFPHSYPFEVHELIRAC